MALPRPVLLAVLGLALCAAAFLATRGAREPGAAVTAAPTPAPVVHAAKPAHKPVAAPRHHAKAPARPAVRTHAPAKPATKAPAAPAPAKPQAPADVVRVTQALDRGDAVVFFFTRAGAADDTGTRQAVKALHGVRHVTVVSAGLGDLEEYRPVLSGAGVSQVPAVVVVKKGQPGRLLQGFVDGGTLRQTVADALR